MLFRRELVRLLLIPLAGVLAASTAASAKDWCGNCQYNGTLFRWGCAPEVTGGPKRDEPLVTDRPDFTEASVTVGVGVVQVETGYTYFYDSGPGGTLREHSFPEALFRIGFYDDWLEFRIAQNIGWSDNGVTTVSGASDTYLGFKLALTPQAGILPEMALVPQMTVPTGAPAFTDNQVLPGINWLYGWEVNEFLAWGGSTQYNRRVDGTTGDGYTEWAQSFTINYTLTEKLGAYTEWFAFFPNSADTEVAQHYLDGGLTYKQTDNIQWDIRGGVGLSDSAADYFVGIGLSMRFL